MHILDLNKHFHQLQIDLNHWSSTPDYFLTGISVIFPDFPPTKDVVYHALFNVNDTDGEPQEHVMLRLKFSALFVRIFT
jgi:hypothetical protein